MEYSQISPEIQRYLELTQKELEQERIRRMTYENDNAQLSAFNPIKEPNLVEYQLDLKEELDRIYHLLSGHIIVVREDGSEIWEEPEDDRLKIFSPYGVKQIMNIISFYINRNTLMSYYDEKTIKWKMRDFGIEISDLIFNRYEAFFHFPTPEELYEKYYPILNKQNSLITEEELYAKCVQWSREELQQKFRHYPMIILALVDSVDSTYRRALMGKERSTLRERVNISQSTSPITDSFNQPQMQTKKSFMNPKTW